MSTHEATVIGCIIALVISIIGALTAEKKIIQGVTKIKPMDNSIINLSFIGITLIELLPVLILIFTLIVIMN
ncbi:hypothetical protein DESME_04345 [Desulfitobacterium metallireducens DSM 15288]|uniref:Uncharacterized protein n=2 Tax=Desulfitobacterium TaxID=36853 RepID=W0ECH2_9FIRM|nr:hypothetical protein DESME_04345 [Desulfitobacterium metallireducens DSM 15288]